MAVASLALAVLLSAAPGRAAIPARPKFLKYTINDGLSHNWVYSVLKDSRGFLWIGTRNGLNKFDGHRFTRYMQSPDDTSSISGNRITSILEDRSGFLWVGTHQNGLSRYDRRLDRFTRFTSEHAERHGFSSQDATCLLETRNGAFWVGTSTRGILVRDRPGGRFRTFERNDLYDGRLRVSALLQDRSGRVWIGANGAGVDVFDPSGATLTRLALPGLEGRRPADTFEQTLFEDSDGDVWIGSRGDGAWRFSPRTRRFERFEPGLTPARLGYGQVTDFAEREKGRIWISTDNGGIYVFDKGRRSFSSLRSDPNDPDGLNSNGVLHLYTDREGTIWIGTFDGGVNALSPYAFPFACFSPVPGAPLSLSHHNVISLCRGAGRTVWVGTDGGGLNRFDPDRGTFERFPFDERSATALRCPFVTALLRDRLGRLWIAGYESGLSVFDPARGTVRHLKHDERDPGSLSSNNVWTLLEDRDGAVWAGTLGGGLDRWNPGTGGFVHYPPDPSDPESLPNGFIITLFEDSRGRLWVGTETGGLARFDRSTGKCARYVHDPRDESSLSNNTVNSVVEDRRGTLWIGTEAGLNRFDPETGKFRAFRTEQGLVNPFVFDVVEDARGALWISTAGGLSRLDPETLGLLNYRRDDGLASDLFSQSASLTTGDGWILFGSLGGLIAFHPDSLRSNSSLPPVVFTDFQIFNTPVPVGRGGSPLSVSIGESDGLRLRRRHNVFSIGFAALEFIHPQRIRYRYRMAGFERDWTETGEDRRRITYTNLPGGDYVFEVQTTGPDGRWKGRTASLTITVVPPFHHTPLFRGLAALVLLGLVTGAHALRTRRIHRENARLAALNVKLQREIGERIDAENRARASLREKEVLLKEIHHRVKNNLQLITSLLNLQSSRIEDPRLHAVFEDGKRRIRSMALVHEKLYQSSDLAHIPFADYVRSLVDVMHASYSRPSRPVRCHIDVDRVDLPLTAAVPCGLVINELVSNAFKYAFAEPAAKPGRVDIRMRLEGCRVELTVKDNGVGLPEGVNPETAKTLGLNLVSILVNDQLKGRLTLDRRKGTCFRIAFDLSPDGKPPAPSGPESAPAV